MKTKRTLPLLWCYFAVFAMMMAMAMAATAAVVAPSAPPADSVPPNPFGPKADVPPPAPATTTVATPKPAATETFVASLRQILLDCFSKDTTGTLTAREIGEARALLNGEPAPAGPVAAAAGANGPLFGLRPLLMQRFDKNGDGVLDATELAAAKAFFLAGQKPPAPKPADLDTLRQQIYQHFSAKGDATLTADERAAAKSWLQQMIADLDNRPNAKPADSVTK
jgi:hypothetical protein